MLNFLDLNSSSARYLRNLNDKTTFDKYFGGVTLFPIIDFIKIDTEGFEYEVIDDIIKHNIKPKQILLEFHHFYPTIGNIKTELYINKIKQYGYNLFYVSNNFCEFSFILV